VNTEVKKATKKATRRPKKRRGDPDDGPAGALAKVG
jgi:hypothetical protein